MVAKIDFTNFSVKLQSQSNSDLQKKLIETLFFILFMKKNNNEKRGREVKIKKFIHFHSQNVR